MAVFLEHSTALIDAWFLRSDPERQVAQMAVNLFAPLRDALADAIATHNLYAPSMATISVARNMLLERGAMIQPAHRGIRLPRFPGLEERQHFNAHHRINRFRLLLPMTDAREGSYYSSRFDFLSRAKAFAAEQFPAYSAPIPPLSTVPSEVTPSAGRRLRVAVVPEQFPRDVDDVAGIFARDYVEAVRPHCDVVVVLVRADGQRPGVGRTRAEDGIEYVTCRPAIRDGGSRRQRLGRLEGLCRVGLTARLLQDVDLIHAHGAVFHGVPAVTLGRRLGLPVVLTVHTGPFAKLLRRRTTRFLTRRTLERADCVCPVSRRPPTANRGQRIRPTRPEVTYNPVDTALFRPPPRLGQVNRRILFAGVSRSTRAGFVSLGRSHQSRTISRAGA